MTFTLLVVVSTSQPGVFVTTAYRALIGPLVEDAMGRSCILDSHLGRWMPAAVRMPAVVWMPACHSITFKGERPIGPPQANTANHQGLMPPPPPMSFPTPCPYPGGGGLGDRHLVTPNFFVAAHYVVVWVIVLWGTATCILCTHGRTFCSLSLKWIFTAQPCFPLGQM